MPTPKPKPDLPETASAPGIPGEIETTLHEFCRGLSSRPGASVELIAAFHADERRKGTVKGLPSSLDARFAAYRARPIQ